eukprot:gene18552-37532_t
MRSEMLTLVLHIDKERDPAVGVRETDEEMSPCKTFEFTSLKNELCVDGVYLRLFIKSGGDSTGIEDPSKFCLVIVNFIRDFIPHRSIQSSTVNKMNFISNIHQELAVATLQILIEKISYIPEDISKSPESIELIFDLLRMSTSNSTSSSFFMSTLQMLPILSTSPSFIKESAKTSGNIQILLQLVCSASTTTPTTITTTTSEPLNVLWSAIEGFAAIPEGLSSLLSASAVPLLLGIVFNVQGFNSSFQNRLAATTLLSKFLWHPYKGPEIMGILRRFLPDPVVSLIRSKGGTVVSCVLDCPAETPELIWTTEMQTELREALVALLRNRRGSQTTVDNDHSS